MRSQELLKLRLASKRWKTAVEKTLENHPVRHPLMARDKTEPISENHFNYHRIRNYPLGASKFEQADDIDKFLEEMANFQGNPFPGKSVIVGVYEDDDANFPKIIANLVVLLKKFGKHVLHLHLEFDIDVEVEQYIANLELYTNFLICLYHVPNLKYNLIDFERRLL